MRQTVCLHTVRLLMMLCVKSKLMAAKTLLPWHHPNAVKLKSTGFLKRWNNGKQLFCTVIRGKPHVEILTPYIAFIKHLIKKEKKNTLKTNPRIQLVDAVVCKKPRLAGAPFCSYWGIRDKLTRSVLPVIWFSERRTASDVIQIWTIKVDLCFLTCLLLKTCILFSAGMPDQLTNEEEWSDFPTLTFAGKMDEVLPSVTFANPRETLANGEKHLCLVPFLQLSKTSDFIFSFPSPNPQCRSLLCHTSVFLNGGSVTACVYVSV